MAIANELVTLLGFKMDEKSKGVLERAEKQIDNLRKSLLKFTAVTTATLGGWGLFINSTANGAEQISDMARATKMSTTELQEWLYAANSAGASASAVTADFAKIQQQAQWTGRSLEDFVRIFDGVSDERAGVLGKNFGFSGDTVKLLREGERGISALRQEAHLLGAVIPPEGMEQAKRFRRRVDEIKYAVSGLASQVAIGAMPALERLAAGFKQWLVLNGTWLQSGTAQFMQGITAGFERFGNKVSQLKEKFQPLIDSVDSFFESMSLSEWMTGLVSGALGVLALLLAPLALKFALISVAIFAASVLMEDFIEWINTGGGAIGDLLKTFEEKFPGIYGFLKKLGEFVQTYIVNIFEVAWGVIKELFKMLAWGFGHIIDFVDWVLGKMGFAEEGGEAAPADTPRPDTELMAHLLGVDPQDWTEEDRELYQQYSASRPALDVPASDGGPRTIHNEAKTTIYVDGSRDPLATAQEIERRANAGAFGMFGGNGE